MLNDKWIGEGIVRLLGRDGSVFVQGAVNQDVETARILPRISHKAHNQKTLCAFFAFSRLFKCVQSCGPLGKLAGFLSRPADN
jgi:hypothetical protein